MKADVDDWLFDFLGRHRARYRPWDWPEPGSEEEVYFLQVWSVAFRKLDASEGEADDASISLGATPPKYRADHLPAVLRAIEAARKEQARSGMVGRWAPCPAERRDPVVFPPGVRDMREYWRHLARLCGADERSLVVRRVRARRPWDRN
jgi:hypothetical protein